jgi:hypothetical protein
VKLQSSISALHSAMPLGNVASWQSAEADVEIT